MEHLLAAFETTVVGRDVRVEFVVTMTVPVMDMAEQTETEEGEVQWQHLLTKSQTTYSTLQLVSVE